MVQRTGTDLGFHHFEWDENKRLLNIKKHGIDFQDAVRIFFSEILLLQADRSNEERWRAIGILSDRAICIVYTERNGGCRIISARRARTKERRAYYALLGQKP